MENLTVNYSNERFISTARAEQGQIVVELECVVKDGTLVSERGIMKHEDGRRVEVARNVEESTTINGSPSLIDEGYQFLFAVLESIKSKFSVKEA